MRFMKNKTLIDYIDEFMELFPYLTKEESDTIEKVLDWDNEKKAGFKFAKRIFEEKDESLD
jgi:hypothetical protein